MLINYGPGYEAVEVPEFINDTDFIRKYTISTLFGIMEGNPQHFAPYLNELFDLNFPDEYVVEYENWESSEQPLGSLSVREKSGNQRLVIKVVRDFLHCHREKE